MYMSLQMHIKQYPKAMAVRDRSYLICERNLLREFDSEAF